MLKRALQVAITFGLLTASYAGYVRGFELVALRLSQTFEESSTEIWRVPSKNEREKTELAKRILGPEHWAAQPGTQSYYNADRGFWMYFIDFERINEGRQIDFRPFAVIWDSHDGKGCKTATSESARVDLDKPLNVALRPGSTALRVTHAKLERDVRIRDNKGTADPADDLRIGPLTSVEYDEAKLQITSDSEVIMDDRDLHLTGIGLLIQLRPREDQPASQGSSTVNPGFNGAQTIIVKKNVFIAIQDVGNAGILPNPSVAGQRKQGKTPIELRCDHAMRIDLPKPSPFVKIGPPKPTGPTLAHFSRNVEVLRGVADAPRDELHCDNLHLTLAPGPKGEVEVVESESKVALKDADPSIESPPAAEADAETSQGPLTELTLKQADATGHNVQLVSAANGLKARCNELIHKKQLPFASDETYLRGEPGTKVIIEKTDIAADGPEKGKVTSYTHIKTIDATIFDDGDGDNASTIVARGPGELESHPGIDKPVERRARWLDQLTLQNIMVTEKADPAIASSESVTSLRKLITLTGEPSFEEVPAKTTLNARSKLVLRLKPKAPVEEKDVTKEAEGIAAAEPKETFEIENLVALDDVYLIAPGQNLHARNRLDAVFAADPAILRAGTTKPADPEAKPATPKPEKTPEGEPKAPPEPAQEKPPEPSATAIADRVWARVFLKPKEQKQAAADIAAAPTGPRGVGGQNAQIDKVYLRGNVTFDKDPDLGKVVGTHIKGQAIDLFNQGKNLNKFVVYHVDPSTAVVQKTSLKPVDAKAGQSDQAIEDLSPLAEVKTDEITIRSLVISLDQQMNIAAAEGRGSLTTMTAPGLLSEKTTVASLSETEQGRDIDANLDPDLARAEFADPIEKKPTPAKKKTPLTITWKQGMKFFGSSTDQQGRAAAMAEFYEKVHAFTDEADMKCDDMMRVYMDKNIQLIPEKKEPKPAKDANAATVVEEPKEARADVAVIECVENFVVENRKFDPETRMAVQKQRIRGNYLVYYKLTGKFRVPGAGIVDLYEIEKPKGTKANELRLGENKPIDEKSDARIVRVAGPQSPPLPRPNGGVAAPVIGHGTAGRGFGQANVDKARTKARQLAAKRLPLILTTVKFKNDMIGRFGTGAGEDKKETRWADFFGDVESIRGEVKSFTDTLDPDSPPSGSQFLTSQVLRVISEPDRVDPKAPPRYLLQAWENAYATVDNRTIQADTITFDSRDERFFAYGLEGRNVVIAEQDQRGQPGSTTTGQMAFYNRKTGASELVHPDRISLSDSKTGMRPLPEKPVIPKLKPVKPKRSKFRNPRMNVERKDFKGS